MVDAIVTDLLAQLVSIAAQQAQQEIKLIAAVDKEVQMLKDGLRIVQAMLNNAEERQVSDVAVKLWFDQLKDVYYMMDDVLDTWNTARIKSQIQKEEEEEEKTDKSRAVKKVGSFLPSLSFCFRRVKNLALRHEIGHKIKTLNETLDKIVKDRVTYGFDLTKQHDVIEHIKTTSFVDVSNIIGRENYRGDLLSNLLGKGSQEDRKPQVISLVGMGGIGKSTLAQLAYNDPEVQAHFQVRMWVCVSEPFDQCKIARAICQELDSESPHNITELQSLLHKICDLIRGKKFLLVLDDVWTEDSTMWEPFKFALEYGAKGSKILVTTRKYRVAERMGSVHIINLGVLSDEDCWLMISKIVFFDNDQHKDLEDLGKQLANKCKGLPLAAKTLGGVMRNKRSRDQWKNMLDSSLWELEDFEKGLLAPLLLSYYELPLELKRCFSYCAVFPKDYLFSKDQLVLLWMAQGYIESKVKTEMEIIAGEYFENLAMRSFFQDFEKDESDDKITRCKMHDIVHDFAQSMITNEFVAIDGDMELEIDYKSVHHLRLKFSKEMLFPVSVYHAENIRTLFLLSDEIDYNFNMLISNLFQNFRCLRTFILDCPIKKIPDVVENLIHLRFLLLSTKVEIEELPETICNLCNLQTLRIDNCYRLKKLPQGMSKLINLRHLIFDTYAMTQFPRRIGRLISLRTLSHFIISGKDDKEGCKLGELKNLNQLQGTLRIQWLGNVVDVCEAKNAQLKKKTHLRGLYLGFEGEDENDRRINNNVLVLNDLEPHPDLEYLEIYDYQGTTIYPNWMISLMKLKTLCFFACPKLKGLPPLGKLPFLESLSIIDVESLEKVGVEFLGLESIYKKDNIFPQLKSLKFSFLKEWKEWVGIGGMRNEEINGVTIMPCLQDLTISRCPKLKVLPYFLRTTPLKKLDIFQCPILGESCQKEIGEDWSKISHIPNIKIDWKYMQTDDGECDA